MNILLANKLEKTCHIARLKTGNRIHPPQAAPNSLIKLLLGRKFGQCVLEMLLGPVGKRR